MRDYQGLCIAHGCGTDRREGEFLCDSHFAIVSKDRRFEALKPQFTVAGVDLSESTEQLIARVTRERDHHQNHVRELQEKLDTQLLERRALLSTRVREFFVIASQRLLDRPKVPEEGNVRFRLSLIAEEFFELLGATFEFEKPLDAANVRFAREAIDAIVSLGAIKVALPEFVRELADLDYVIEGARQAFGINGAPIMDVVHKANMAKLGGPRDAMGKLLKPEGWIPPDVAGELKKQGWRPR